MPREVASAIELVPPPHSDFMPQSRPRPAHFSSLSLSPTHHPKTSTSIRTHERDARAHISGPRPAAANTSAARCESVIVTHHQLRFDLRDCIHGDAHHNQQRGSAKIEINVQTVRYPRRQSLEERSNRSPQVIQVNTGDHPLWNKRNDDQVQLAHQSNPRKNLVDVVGSA